MKRVPLIGVTFTLAVGVATASAQMVPVRTPASEPMVPTSTSKWAATPVSNSPAPAPTTAGSFDQLSTGNQKIARALYGAQRTDATGTLTLDQIAAMKESGQGWGEVFKDLRSRGLITEKNLGQVVSRYQRPSTGLVTTAGNGMFQRSVRHTRSVDADDRHAGSPAGDDGVHGSRYSGSAGRGQGNAGGDGSLNGASGGGGLAAHGGGHGK
jgi:hypothetical protein